MRGDSMKNHTPDVGDCSALVETHWAYAQRLALMQYRKYGETSDLDQLLSDAGLGLLKASEHYDPARGVTFGTHASHWVLGEIREGQRRADWVPRRVRDSGAKLCRMVHGESCADKPDTAEPPQVALERTDWWRWLTADLDARDQLIVACCYRAGMSHSEVARVVPCSPSMVGHRLKTILPILRARLTA